MSAEQRKLANSLRARKAHVTTRGRHLQESLDALTNVSPAILCSRLKESLSRYEGAVKGVEETYILLEEQVDDAVYNDWVAKHQEYIGPCEAKIAEAVQKIAAWEEAAYAAHAAAAPQRQQQGAAPPREPMAKAVDALRPETLPPSRTAVSKISTADTSAQAIFNSYPSLSSRPTCYPPWVTPSQSASSSKTQMVSRLA